MNEHDDKVRKLAREFHSRIRERLTDQLEEVDRLNSLEVNRDTYCATLDFCDADVYMGEAFEEATGQGLRLERPLHCKIWDEAWNIAMEHGFNREWEEGP